MLPQTDRQTERELTGFPSIDKPWLKFYTEEAINAEPFNGSVYSHVWQKNKDYLSNYALEYYGKKFTFEYLFDNVDKIASALVGAGVKKRDNVGMLMSSCPEMVCLMLALNKIGAVANMINPLFMKDQIIDILKNTNVRVLFVLDKLYGIFAGIKDELSIDKVVVVPITKSMPFMVKMVAGIKLRQKIEYNDKVIDWNRFVSGAINKTEINNDIDSPAIMVYSSGTTGASKSIVLMNKGINATIAHYEFTGFKYERCWSYLQMIPVWFSTGIIFSLLMPLCLGMRVVLEPAFSVDNFIRDLLKYEPNMITIPTTIWNNALDAVGKKKNLSFLHYPITGGEFISEEFEKQINKNLSQSGCKAELLKGYGMCELGSTVTATSPKYNKYGATGYPIKGVVVSAFDLETNCECKYNERGEIRVLSPARMKEYYMRPDATQEFFWKDDEGREWGCTGDVGYVDEDGFVFVEGRAADYFISESGKKTYCFDIENLLLMDVAVSQSEVIAIKTNDGFEKSIGFVLGDAERFDERRLIEMCREKFEYDQIPVAIKLLDKFPAAPSGKRDMSELRKIAAESIKGI